jgi:hypothetical protein
MVYVYCTVYYQWEQLKQILLRSLVFNDVANSSVNKLVNERNSLSSTVASECNRRWEGAEGLGGEGGVGNYL